MGVTNVFARKELKYRLTASQDRFLREALAPYVRPDQYGESSGCGATARRDPTTTRF